MRRRGWYDVEEGWENQLLLKNQSGVGGKIDLTFMSEDEKVLVAKTLEVGAGETLNFTISAPDLQGRQGPLFVVSELQLSGYIRYHNKKTCISFNRALEPTK